MRRHLLHIAAMWLVLMVLAGCQETSTDPDKEGTAGQSHGLNPRMNPAISRTDSGKTVAHFTADGDFGDVFWGNVISFCAFVSVSRTGPTSTPGVFLSYEIRSCGIACDEGICPPPAEGGFGEIPVGDLTLSGRTVNGRKLSALKLNTNTSASSNPNFNRFAGAGGQITIEWDRAPGFEFLSTGQSVTKFGTFTERVHGTSTTFSATATGTVVGFSIQSEGQFFEIATIGSNHTKTVDISH